MARTESAQKRSSVQQHVSGDAVTHAQQVSRLPGGQRAVNALLRIKEHSLGDQRSEMRAMTGGEERQTSTDFSSSR
jgi:hypothetical protein